MVNAFSCCRFINRCNCCVLSCVNRCCLFVFISLSQGWILSNKSFHFSSFFFKISFSGFFTCFNTFTWTVSFIDSCDAFTKFLVNAFSCCRFINRCNCCVLSCVNRCCLFVFISLSQGWILSNKSFHFSSFFFKISFSGFFTCFNTFTWTVSFVDSCDAFTKFLVNTICCCRFINRCNCCVLSCVNRCCLFVFISLSQGWILSNKSFHFSSFFFKIAFGSRFTNINAIAMLVLVVDVFNTLTKSIIDSISCLSIINRLDCV